MRIQRYDHRAHVSAVVIPPLVPTCGLAVVPSPVASPAILAPIVAVVSVLAIAPATAKEVSDHGLFLSFLSTSGTICRCLNFVTPGSWRHPPNGRWPG